MPGGYAMIIEFVLRMKIFLYKMTNWFCHLDDYLRERE